MDYQKNKSLSSSARCDRGEGGLSYGCQETCTVAGGTGFNCPCGDGCAVSGGAMMFTPLYEQKAKRLAKSPRHSEMIYIGAIEAILDGHKDRAHSQALRKNGYYWNGAYWIPGQFFVAPHRNRQLNRKNLE